MQICDEFEYQPETGAVLWKTTRRGRGCTKGREAGSIKADGRYRTIFVRGRRLYCHRIVWELHNGQIPEGMCIDHIDGNGLNNRIENLRLATLSDNQKNSKIPKNNKTGYVGVYLTRNRKKYYAVCSGKSLGTFDDLGAAVLARKSAQQTGGFHENHGTRK